VVGKSGPNQVFETLLQGRPLIISSFLANEKQTTDWVIRSKAGWLTRTPEHLATLLAKLAAHPQILEEYRKSIAALKLRSGAPEICQFLYGLVKEKRPPRKRPMADALRRLQDAVRAEGAALTRRIDASLEAGRESRRGAAGKRSASRARTAALRARRRSGPIRPSP